MVMSNSQKMNRNLLIVSGVAIGIGLIIFVVGWVYIFRISRNVSKLNTEAQSFADENMVLSDLKLDLARLGSNKDIVYQIVPVSKDVSDFLATFEGMAINNHVTISGVNVGDAQKKTKGGSEFSQTVSKDQYYEFPIKYEVSGNYLEITKLIADVTGGRRLASVNNLVVSTDTSDKNIVGKVKADFVVTVYVKK